MRKTPILNQSGMSLVGIMVGVVIISIMALSVATLAKNMSEIYEAGRIRDDAASTTFLISNFLRNREICKATLIPNPTGIAITSVQVPDGRGVPQVVSADSNTPLLNRDQANIEAMRLEPFGGDEAVAGAVPGQYLAQLRIVFRTRPGTLGGQLKDRTIPVYMLLGSGGARAIDCQAMEPIPQPGTGEDGGPVNPHNYANNCQGQYYPLPDGATSVDTSPDGIPTGLRRVGPATREALLAESPPVLVRNPSPDAIDERENSPPVVEYIEVPNVVVPESPHLDRRPGQIRTINGRRYYVTSTIEQGISGRSGTEETGSCNSGSRGDSGAIHSYNWQCSGGTIARVLAGSRSCNTGDGGSGGDD